MGFNFAHEKRKFQRAWIRTAQQYREAGMCCEQINAMEELEIQQFNQFVAVRRNTVTVPPADFWCVAPESVHMDSYFEDIEEYMDELLEGIRPGLSVKLIQQDKEILKNFYYGKNQRETAEILGLSQQTVSYRLKRIKKIFGNFL